MDLIPARHPSVHSLDPADEAQVHALFQRHPMVLGNFELHYDRQPCFRALLNAQGREATTWVVREKEGLAACASHSTTRRWVNGRLLRVHYLSDLRVQASLHASRAWRAFFPDLIRLLEKDEEALHLTAILEANTLALRALAGRSSSPRYHLLRQPQMVNVFGRPLAVRRPTAVRYVRSGEKQRLLEFLQAQAKTKFLGYDFPAEFEHRLQTWPDYGHERFLVYDEKNHWLGVCFPWSPSPLKRMMFHRAPWFLRQALGSLKMIGRRPPRIGEALETIYLTHFYGKMSVSKLAAAFCDFLQCENVFHRCHMLSFCAPTPLEQWPRGVFTILRQTVPARIFQVTLEENAAAVTSEAPIDFEMSLV